MLFVIEECTDDKVLMEALQGASTSLGGDLLDVLDSLFILLERSHSKFTLSSILLLLETLPDSTAFSFLSNIPCDKNSVEWIVQSLLSESRSSSAFLMFVMVFYCKWADSFNQVQSFPLLGLNLMNSEHITQTLERILKRIDEVTTTREIPYLDAFLVYLFHNEPSLPKYYQSIAQRLLCSRHELIYRFIEILLKERKPWQYQSMCGFFSVVKEISPHYMIPLIQFCPSEECVDLFLSHWLQYSGLSAVTDCMHGSLSRHIRERLFVALLGWSQSVPDSGVVTAEEEKLIDSVLSSPNVVLQALRKCIPPTHISESHFSSLLHAIIKRVESNDAYIPLVFLTAHDPKYHSSALIESCHNLVNNCLNQQLTTECRSASSTEILTGAETTEESLLFLFKNVSISAIFLLLLGAKDLPTLSTLFVAMMVEAGIKEKESIQEMKSLLLFPPVLSDLLQHSNHPLVSLYLLEYVDSNQLDPSTYVTVLLDILSNPIQSIDYNDLFERNQEILSSIKESFNLSWNVRMS